MITEVTAELVDGAIAGASSGRIIGSLIERHYGQIVVTVVLIVVALTLTIGFSLVTAHRE